MMAEESIPDLGSRSLDLLLQLHDAVDQATRVAAGSRGRRRRLERPDPRPGRWRSCRRRRRPTRRRPSRSPTSDRASGRTRAASPAPSCATGGRPRSSGRTGAASRGRPRRRTARCRSGWRPSPSSRSRSRPGRTAPARSPTGAPTAPAIRTSWSETAVRDRDRGRGRWSPFATLLSAEPVRAGGEPPGPSRARPSARRRRSRRRESRRT